MLLLRNPSNRRAGRRHRHPPAAGADGLRPGRRRAPARRGWRPRSTGPPRGCGPCVLERTAPGGQAGSSMRIENYLGFPTGMTGSELADRATLQANKFGARLSVPGQVVRLEFDKAYAVLAPRRRRDGHGQVPADRHRGRLPPPRRRGLRAIRGGGRLLRGDAQRGADVPGREVVVVGGGNSAGQAAVFLAGHARRVLLVIRGDDLNKSMSSYLARRIEQTANIELFSQHHGPPDGRRRPPRRRRDRRRRRPGTSARVETPAVFSFIGATPRTEWLPPEIETDARGIRPDRGRRWRTSPRGPAGGRRSCWRRAAPGCSPPATCGRVRSSAWPRPSARGRWRCSSSTSTSRRCDGRAEPSVPALGATRESQEGRLKYLCLVYAEEQKIAELSGGEWDAVVAENLALCWELRRSGHYVGAAPLDSVETAATVRGPPRQAVDHRRPLRRDEGAARRILPHRGARSRRGRTDRRADPGRALRKRRGPPPRGARPSRAMGSPGKRSGRLRRKARGPGAASRAPSDPRASRRTRDTVRASTLARPTSRPTPLDRRAGAGFCRCG